MSIKLYDYFRSSASFRVRIALNLKGLDYEKIAIHLVKDGGQQLSDDYRVINPQRLVPALQHGDNLLTQSIPILEYLDEQFPEPPLLPADAVGRAQVRAMAQVIGADTHPIQNLRVLKYLKHSGFDQDGINAWASHWIETGFAALEAMLDKQQQKGPFFWGDRVTLADIVIAPQLLNAKRFGADLTGTPRVVEICERLLELPAFDDARPENQPEFEP